METQGTLFEELEDKASASPKPGPALTEDALRAGGYRPVRAFVPSEGTPNARRIRKNRLKNSEAARQLNVVAPACGQARGVLKRVAQMLRDGSVTLRTVEILIDDDRARAVELERCRAVLDDAGWRAWFLRRLILPR